MIYQEDVKDYKKGTMQAALDTFWNANAGKTYDKLYGV